MQFGVQALTGYGDRAESQEELFSLNKIVLMGLSQAEKTSMGPWMCPIVTSSGTVLTSRMTSLSIFIYPKPFSTPEFTLIQRTYTDHPCASAGVEERVPG